MKRLALLTLFTVALAARAEAGPITWSSGDPSASLDFSIVNGNLQVTLTNTSMVGARVPTDILTGVFFDLGDYAGALNPVSALLGGSQVVGGPDGGGNVGGEWAYAGNIGGATPGGQYYGIGSAGLDIFGEANFKGSNLDGPTAVNGLSYGILPAGGISANANKKVYEKTALIQNSVVFTLAGLPSGFSLTNYTYRPTNVYFQYGTSLVSVPEPATLLLLVPGVTAVLVGRRRLRRKKPTQLS
jgi:hypothetical protein